MNQFKWCCGALDWNPDDLALVRSLYADFAQLVVLGVTFKE